MIDKTTLAINKWISFLDCCLFPASLSKLAVGLSLRTKHINAQNKLTMIISITNTKTIAIVSAFLFSLMNIHYDY